MTQPPEETAERDDGMAAFRALADQWGDARDAALEYARVEMLRPLARDAANALIAYETAVRAQEKLYGAVADRLNASDPDFRRVIPMLRFDYTYEKSNTDAVVRVIEALSAFSEGRRPGSKGPVTF